MVWIQDSQTGEKFEAATPEEGKRMIFEKRAARSATPEAEEQRSWGGKVLHNLAQETLDIPTGLVGGAVRAVETGDLSQFTKGYEEGRTNSAIRRERIAAGLPETNIGRMLAAPGEVRDVLLSGKPYTQEELFGVAQDLVPFAGTPAPGRIPASPMAPRVPPVVERGPPGTMPYVPPTGEEVVATGARQGVPVPRGIASDSPMVNQTAASMARTLGGGAMRQAEQQFPEAIGARANQVAAGYSSGGGPPPGPAAAGNIIREGVGNYIGPVTKGKVTAAYDAVDRFVDPNAMISLPETRWTAQHIASQRSNAALPTSGATDVVVNAVARPEGMNYQGIKKLRSSVGEMLDNPSALPAGTNQAELKQLYGALTGDLRAAVMNAGGERAVAAFDRANNYARLVADRRENLNRLLGTNNSEGAFARIADAAGSGRSADVRLLAQARKAMPAEEWGDVVSGVVARIGRDAQGNFSPDRFLTDYARISPAGKNVLFGTTPGSRELSTALDDIATLSTRWQQYQRFTNKSGTAQAGAGIGTIASAVVSPYTLIATVGGPAVLSKILSNPATARAAAAYMRSAMGRQMNPNSAGAQAMAAGARQLAVETGQTLGWAPEAVVNFEKGLSSLDRAMSMPPPGQDEGQ